MTATAHALVGTVIAAKIANPALAIPIAIASHVVLDLTPHWDSGFEGHAINKKRLFWESVADVLLGFLLSYTIIVFIFPQTNLAYAFIMIIMAQLLDWLFAPYYYLNWKFFKWASDFGMMTNTSLDKPWGIITQVMVAAAVILLGKLL